MKSLIEKYIRDVHPNQQIGTLKYLITPNQITIRYWFRPIHQTAELEVLSFCNDEVIGIVHDEWNQKNHVVVKNDFLNWCVAALGVDRAIDAFNNWNN